MTREETIAMVESYISGSLALYVRNVTLNSSGCSCGSSACSSGTMG
jgi:hypothetical protein